MQCREIYVTVNHADNAQVSQVVLKEKIDSLFLIKNLFFRKSYEEHNDNHYYLL